MSAFGERVRAYRLARDMSQEDLAAQAGLFNTTISKIEHGTRKVTLEEAVRLAEVFRVSLGQLAGIEESSHPSALVAHLPVSRCVRKGQKALQELVSAFQELDNLVAS